MRGVEFGFVVSMQVLSSVGTARDTSSSTAAVTDTSVCRGTLQRHRHKEPPAFEQWEISSSSQPPCAEKAPEHRHSSGVRTDPWNSTLGQSMGGLAWTNPSAGRACTTELKLLVSFFIFLTCFLFCPCTKQGCYSESFSCGF